MISIKKTYTFFTFAIISIALVSFDSYAQRRKSSSSKNKTSTPSKESCLACMNLFSSDELKFTSNEASCSSLVSKCDTSNLIIKCEQSINECIKWNCTTSSSCSDELANRSLFYGCLKAENIYMPFHCASYIKGYASSIASEQKAAMQAEQIASQRALEQEKLAQEEAKAQAEAAAAQAEIEKEKIAAQVALQQQQMEAQAALELEQKKYELQEQAKLDELTRQAKLEEQKKNSKPNVKYNNLLSAVKKDLSTAKTYSNKAFNLLGIQTTENQQTNGSMVFFPPQIIQMSAIITGTDAKSKSLRNGSKYRESERFVCTKDTKESFVKTELKNINNLLKKTKTTLADGIAELEALNANDETVGSISDDKITNLYLTLNKLTEIINSVESDMNSLTTTCETRCKGMQTLSMSSTSSGSVEFDENGMIIEEAAKSDDGYSCKDFETSSSTGLDVMSIMSGSTPDMSSMMGGIGQKVTELTKRVTKAVLNTDKALDETEIAIQSGVFEIEEDISGTIDYCVQFITLDIKTYTDCIRNILGQQITALTRNQTDTSITSQLKESIKTILTTLKSPNYSVENQPVYCPETANQTIGSISLSTVDSLSGLEQFRTCVLSITSALDYVENSKTATNKFNFYIDRVVGVGSELQFSISNGTEFLSANNFAENKLSWGDTFLNCQISEDYTRTNQTPSIFGTNNNQSNINDYIFVCICKDNSQRIIPISAINSGAAGRSCSQQQK